MKTTTEDKTYNGWTNYETWNVNLWLDNDQGSQEYWQEQASEVFEQSEADETFTKLERATLTLADTLKEHFENEAQDLLERSGVQCSMWADLLNSSLSEVNWHEIAEHYINELEAK